MKWISKIQKCFNNNLVYYTRHAKIEMEDEKFGKILDSEIFEAISNGDIIEEYINDRPYPSALIFGKTNGNRPLHIVCAYDKEERVFNYGCGKGRNVRICLVEIF